MHTETGHARRDQREIQAAHALRYAQNLSLETLIKQYEALITSTAHKLIEQLQIHVEFDDLMAWGHQGLLEAYRCYKPRKTSSFSSYAYYRLRGAMLDGLRQTGWGVRNIAVKVAASHADSSYNRAGVRIQNGAIEPELFSYCTAGREQPVRRCVVIYLLERSRLELTATTVKPGQSDALTRCDLNAAVHQLSMKQREVLVRHQIHEESMHSIARTLNVSVSWVSRTHATALATLRKLLAEDYESE